MLPSSLTVSVVIYHPDMTQFDRCLRRLALAVGAAREDGSVKSVAVALIDNSEDRAIAEQMIALGNRYFADAGVQIHYLHGHANIGYGAAHNLALHGTGADYQLVLNPDLDLAADALANAIRWLDENPDVGAVAPAVTDEEGRFQYLCRRYPAVFDLFLRGFAPAPVRRIWRARLDRYEMRSLIDPEATDPVFDIPMLSGACLLVRRGPIDATGGFDPKFFLYFEDYDWSIRLGRVTRTAWLPSFRAVHHGGDAARKGFDHIRWFVGSGIRFYAKHGWRWF